MPKKSGRRARKERAEARAKKAPPPPSATADPYQSGVRAFRNGRYAKALQAWEQLGPPTPQRTPAFAEACFRLAVDGGLTRETLPYLERASALRPADPLYAYYLGLALHRDGQVRQALDAYRRAVANGLKRPGAGVVIALAALELDLDADLTRVPGVSPQDAQVIDGALEPLLRPPRVGQPASPAALAAHLGLPAGDPVLALLDGLELLAARRYADAYGALVRIPARSLPPAIDALRWYYAGAAASGRADTEAALAAWLQAAGLDRDLKGLDGNLFSLYNQRAIAAYRAGDWSALVRAADAGLKYRPAETSLRALAVTAHDRLAHQAAEAGNWGAAAGHWSEAREHVGSVMMSGSPRPIVHNLALAYEALERWADAADAWRAMLRTRPRKKAVEGMGDAHWTWVRQRVVEMYRRAGELDQAIIVFRQALKASPDDADLQLDLARALLAHGQAQAAENEANRLLQKHPDYVPALTLLAEVYAQMEYWSGVEQVIRRGLAVEPDNEELQQRLADALIQRADIVTRRGLHDLAIKLYNEALQYRPDDYNIYFDLARAEANAQRRPTAYEYVEKALELGRDEGDSYSQAIVFWVIERNLVGAREVLARATANGKLDVPLLLHAGLFCLERAASARPDGQKPAAPPDSDLEELGREMLDSAIALGPEAGVLQHILSELGPSRVDIALPYARRLVEVEPDDPLAWQMLGFCLGAAHQVKEAQDALRQSARLARRLGMHDLAAEADSLRRAVETPYFAAGMAMASALGEDS